MAEGIPRNLIAGISFLGQLFFFLPRRQKKWINVCVCLCGSVANLSQQRGDPVSAGLRGLQSLSTRGGVAFSDGVFDQIGKRL